MQDLYAENYTTLMKEIKDLNKGRDKPGSWIGRFNIIKIPNFPKFIHRLNTIPILKNQDIL